MPPVSEVGRRHLLKKALRDVLAEGARGLEELEEFARVFQTPDDAYAYLQAFGFRVSKGAWPFDPVPRHGQREGCSHGTFYGTREFLCMAVHAEGYPVAELDAWSRVDGDFAGRYSSYGFKRLAKEGVPGEYAGVLAERGAGLNYVLAAWKNGIPLEYAVAGLDG